MRTLIFAAMVVTAVVTGCSNSSSGNPLLEEFDTPHGTPPFGSIKLEHYMPAFTEAIEIARGEIDAIVNNPDTPTFENTIEALARSGSLLDRTATIFFVLNNSETSPQMEEIANQVMPLLTDFQNDISLNPALFERVEAVYQTRDALQLDAEQRTLLEKTYKDFSRNGAALNDQDKETYRALTSELSTLNLKFAQNVLAATNSFSITIPLEDEHKVEYMPEFVKQGMAAEAAERGEQGWVVTLQGPSYIPFMTYSRERDLKEQLWRAYNTRAYGGEWDNSENVKRIAQLRLEIAQLLGYQTYADYVLEERMAESTSTVNNFLNELLVNTRKWAEQDYNAIVQYARTQEGAPAEFMPWDFGYYDEKYKSEKYELNEELVKPYFKLENVKDGVFMLADRLYGIEIKPAKSIEGYHPDVEVYEVFDNDGSFLSVLYMDYFPRASKRDGAWMTAFREASTEADGTPVRPLVTLNFNFTKPTADAPSLLTFDEVLTFLHEFGHGLHGIFAEGRYSSLTGTSVYRDFVELPSQLMENWATEKEFLDLWAVHYLTGEKIPDDLIEKIIASKNYLAAYSNVRQLAYGMNDMAWHSITTPYTGDPGAFEKAATSRTNIAPVVPGTSMSTAFSHIFAGGYAAGYYSYKWAEVLEADAFSAFQEKGIFNREVAASFRENVLSKGGSEHPMTLYVRFRGHEPQTQALIDKIGEGR